MVVPMVAHVTTGIVHSQLLLPLPPLLQLPPEIPNATISITMKIISDVKNLHQMTLENVLKVVAPIRFVSLLALINMKQH